jgi:hypothetical protein
MLLMQDATDGATQHALEAFVRQMGAGRFLTVQDGQLVCLDPDSPEAQELYQQALEAIAAGTITDLRTGSGAGDREI